LIRANGLCEFLLSELVDGRAHRSAAETDVANRMGTGRQRRAGTLSSRHASQPIGGGTQAMVNPDLVALTGTGRHR